MAQVLGLDAAGIPDEGAADLAGVPEPLRLGDVEVTVLVHPEHAALIDRHFEAAFNGILYFGYWYGRYPYRTLTVVDPAFGGRGAGGMEYPTLITAGSRWLAPSWRQQPESVTVHEFGHQYWYGLVASNEFEESWLDEGLTTYSTGRLLEAVYGPDRSDEKVAGIPLNIHRFFEIPQDPDPNSAESERGALDSDRLLFMRWAGASNETLLNFFRDLPLVTQPRDVPVAFFSGRRARTLQEGPEKDQIVRRAWEYLDRDSYGLNSYSKTAVMLDSLRSILGPPAFDRGLRLYHERHRFGHPSSGDLVSAMSEAAGRDLRWYFDQFLHGSGLLDYGISELKSVEVGPAAGVFGPPGDRRTVSSAEARRGRRVGDAAGAEGEPDGPTYETVVTARRLGEVRIPMEIHLTWEGGRTETRSWDGEYRWLRIRETGPERILAARIGPEPPPSIDSDWSNNAKRSRAERWPALQWWTRLVGWVQNVLYFYSGIS